MELLITIHKLNQYFYPRILMTLNRKNKSVFYYIYIGTKYVMTKIRKDILNFNIYSKVLRGYKRDRHVFPFDCFYNEIISNK